MTPRQHPSAAELIDQSRHEAAKWRRCTAAGDRYFWPAEHAFHGQIAGQLGIAHDTEGLAVHDTRPTL